MAYQYQVNLGVAGGVPGQAATPGQSIYTPKTYLAAPEYTGADSAVHAGVKAGTFVWTVTPAVVSAGISALHSAAQGFGNVPYDTPYYPNDGDYYSASAAGNPPTYSAPPVDGAASFSSYAYVTNEMQKVGNDPKLPLGLVERVVDVPNYDVLTGYSDKVPPYGAVTVAVKGDYFVELDKCFNSAGAAATSVPAGATVYADSQGKVVAAADSANAAMAAAGYAETSFRVVDGGSAGEVVIITNWTIG